MLTNGFQVSLGGGSTNFDVRGRGLLLLLGCCAAGGDDDPVDPLSPHPVAMTQSVTSIISLPAIFEPSVVGRFTVER